MPGQGDMQAQSREYIVFSEFDGMDTQSDRVALDPKKVAWCENLQPIGKNQLTLVPGPSSAIAQANFNIVAQFYAVVTSVEIVTGTNGNRAAILNTKDVMYLFTDTGALYELNLTTQAVQLVAGGGFFTNPDIAQWSSERILIADPQGGYCSWDGNSLTKAGGISPNVTINATGIYSAPPAITITDSGGGTGATALPVLSNGTQGALIGILINNQHSQGYQDPVATFTPNVGSTSVTLSPWPVPTSLPSTLAVYVGRVWLGGGRILAWTGTGGYDDFDEADAAGQTSLTDSDLIHEITAIRALNNYLYIFGDNSVKQIGSVSVVTSTTQYTLVTLSSDQGTIYPLTVRSYNRLILFANKVGVFAIFGASVEKVSDAMDGLFGKADFAQGLQAMTTDVNSIHCYMVLMRLLDPYSGVLRTLILSLMGKKWFVVNAGDNLTAIGSAFLNGVYNAYAASEGTLTPILALNTEPVSFLFRTALTANKKPMQSKRALRAMIGQSLLSSLTATLEIESENGIQATLDYTGNAVVNWLNNAGQQVNWVNAAFVLVQWVSIGYLIQPTQAQSTGIYLGLTLSGEANEFKLLSAVLEYQDDALMRSTNTGS